MRQSLAIRALSTGVSWIGLTALIGGCQQRPAPADGIAAAPAAAPETSVATSANGAARDGKASGHGENVIGTDNAIAAAPAPGATALSASEIARLDSVMTPEAVFPDPAQRGAYRADPPVVKDGKRSYTFELSAQPGMVAGQHFHSITFAFTPASTTRPAAGSEPEIMSGGGPRGSFVRASARSADGAYDVSVMERMLLPNTLPSPAIRADTALGAALQRLERASAP